MIKYLAAILCLTACATTSTGAKGSAASKGPSAADFYPMVIGNSWHYEARVGQTATKVNISLVRQIDGWFEDSSGARFQVDSFGLRDEHRYLIRSPIEAGTKWSNVISVSSVEHYEIIGANQPCEAPAGKWEGCVIVESRNRAAEGKTLVNEMTFAPGVGIVQINTTFEDHGNRVPQVSLVLTSFAPAQPPAPTSSH